jgi:hypothetical protein
MGAIAGIGNGLPVEVRHLVRLAQAAVSVTALARPRAQELGGCELRCGCCGFGAKAGLCRWPLLL